jgi:hypothetical protein
LFVHHFHLMLPTPMLLSSRRRNGDLYIHGRLLLSLRFIDLPVLYYTLLFLSNNQPPASISTTMQLEYTKCWPGPWVVQRARCVLQTPSSSPNLLDLCSYVPQQQPMSYTSFFFGCHVI